VSGPDPPSQDGRGAQPSADFEARLERARAGHGLDAPPQPGQGPKGAWGSGLRTGLELVSALLVGGAIGWGLDLMFGTRPILLGVFLLLGGIAGLLNVVRLTLGRERKGSGPG
jgi:ATP synthase protein I